MKTAPNPSSSSSPDAPPAPANRVDRLSPDQIRIISLKDAETNTTTRVDCYDPTGCLDDGAPDEGQSVFRLVGGTVHVRAIDWAQSPSLDPSVELHWVDTEMRVEDVDRIRVFTWPEAELLQVFRHME